MESLRMIEIEGNGTYFRGEGVNPELAPILLSLDTKHRVDGYTREEQKRDTSIRRDASIRRNISIPLGAPDWFSGVFLG